MQYVIITLKSKNALELKVIKPYYIIVKHVTEGKYAKSENHENLSGG